MTGRIGLARVGITSTRVFPQCALFTLLASVVAVTWPAAADAVGTGAVYVNPHLGHSFQKSSSYVTNNSSGYTQEHQHYFYSATRTMPWNETGNVFSANDVLYAWVYLVRGDTPSEILLQFLGSDGTWNHRAFWGADNLPSVWGAIVATQLGGLPAPGSWCRLSVTAAQVGLTGMSVNGMAFTLYGGFVYWDDAGYLTHGSGAENVWVDDAAPSGAALASDGGDAWTWLTQASTVRSAMTGFMAQKSMNTAGLHQHYFYNATGNNSMTVGANDYLYCWIYIDPIATPSEVMLQWYSPSLGWVDAYWGTNSLGEGVNEGAIPSGAINGWYKLKVSASSLGLGNQNVQGAAFTLYNGAAYWDDFGRLAGGVNGTEHVWVDDAPPPGSTLVTYGGDTW